MQTNATRRQFLDYFKRQGHIIVPSSPVIPHDDPTLLFTNAGMNQFKDVFLGKSHRDYTRATTSQKCIRAGGKHNDLENVGHTKRHLTFFEMLGNFSFGDYFKEDAIKYAWEIAPNVFGFDPKRIWPTIYLDDEEAFKLWTKYVPKERIVRFGEKENFWSMGDVGPCGPCSELLYDRGEKYGDAKNPLEDSFGDRFLEFWNLVFMQYNKKPDGSLEKLPKPSIDTGAGLERIMSLIQNTDSVFETDILRGLIHAIEEQSEIKYNFADEKKAPAFRVIADHLRSLSFAIADGAQPSNVERGYVLRKILRRAVRYGKLLGFEEPFLAKLLPDLTKLMGHDYPELHSAESRIAEILTREEEAFLRTLRRGGNILNQIIEKSVASKKEISGADAFKLKDTYGLPIEEIQLIAKDSDLHVDIEGFELLEREAREKSKSAQKAVSQTVEDSMYKELLANVGASQFVYDHTPITSHVIGLIKNGAFVKHINADENAYVILKMTSFYPEMGGQVGDSGILESKTATFTVEDTKSPYKGVIVHIGTLTKGTLKVGDTLNCKINLKRREQIANNHTATHLLHFALQKVLGSHIKQAGSVVDSDRLRFDFMHHNALTPNEIRQIEMLVNEKIRENLPVQAYEIPFDEAQKRKDIVQLFGEKYGSTVRVIDIDFSKELCGGTHTTRTGNIGYFRIVKESSIAAGSRRIEAVTGKAAEEFAYTVDNQLKTVAEKLKIPENKLQERLDTVLTFLNEYKKRQEMEEREEIAKIVKEARLEKKISANKIEYIAKVVSLDSDALKKCIDQLSLANPNVVIALGCITNGKAQIMIAADIPLTNKGIKSNELLKPMLAVINGNGGGRPHIAQGSGPLIEKLQDALDLLSTLL